MGGTAVLKSIEKVCVCENWQQRVNNGLKINEVSDVLQMHCLAEWEHPEFGFCACQNVLGHPCVLWSVFNYSFFAGRLLTFKMITQHLL